MSNLTPMKAVTASSQHGTTEELQKILASDFEDAVYQNVSVVSFVQTVWGLSQSETQIITDSVLSLRVDSLAKYVEILSAKGQYETALHQPFREMARALLKDIGRLLFGNNGTFLTYLWDGLGKATLKSEASPSNGQSRTRKPDLLEVYIPSDEDGHLTLDPDEVPLPTNAPLPNWSQVRAALEFKKKVVKQSPLAYSIVASDLPIDSRSDDEAAAVSMGRSSSSESGSVESTESPLQSGKRMRSSNDNSRMQTKRIRVGATKDELQLATYALESLFAGNRHYTTGFLVDGIEITIWYYDRTAAMSCVSFDFTTPEGITNLALSLFALSQCNMRQAGFDPYLYHFTATSHGEVITAIHVVPVIRPTADFKGLCYRFPGAEDLVFVIKEIISRYRGVNGRGTFVAIVNKVVIGSPVLDVDYAIKLSWQENTRTHEGDIISKVRAAIPGWCDYLPDPVFKHTIRAADVDLPRAHIRQSLLKEGRADKALELEDRDLHVFVTNRFQKLWKVDSVDEFKRVFLDCLECE